MENTRRNIKEALFGVLLTCVMAFCFAMMQPANAFAESYGTQNSPVVITKSGTTINCPAGSGMAYYMIKTQDTMAVKLTHKGATFLKCYPAAEPADDVDWAYDVPNYTEGFSEDIVYIPKNKGNGIIISFERGSDATVTVEFEKFDFGKVTVDLSGGSKMKAGEKRKFNATYTKGINFGKENDSYLNVINNESVRFLKNCKFSFSFTAKEAGYTNLSFAMRSEHESAYSTQTWQYVPIVVSPAKPAKPGKDAISGNNKKLQILFPATAANGKKITLQMKKNGKWKDVKTVAVSKGVATVTGLSASKTYSFRYYGFCPAEGAGKPKLTSPYSSVFTATTAPSTKPKVLSIKVVGAKETYHQQVYHPGKWVADTWYPGWSTPAYYDTTYTVKVTLRSAVKGAKGISINGSWVNGKGKTFTTKITDQGRCKGKNKKFTIKAGTSSRILGAAVSKTGRIA